MNITIEIHYKSDSGKALQRGSFPLRGKKPELVAYDWWKKIKHEMSYRVQIEEILFNGGVDITELVKKLEDKEWETIESNFDLPF